MNIIPIALRNTLRQKKRSFLLAGAIGFGMIVMTLLGGFTSGIIVTVKENMSDMMSGHIYITAKETSPGGVVSQVVRDRSVIESSLDASGIEFQSTTLRSTLKGSMIFGTKEVNQPVSGLDWDNESRFLQNLDIVRGSVDDLSDPKALILPENTARRLKVEIGEEIIIHNTTVSGQNNLGEFHLIATTENEGAFGSGTAYAGILYINELINIAPSEFTNFSIYLNDIDESGPASAAIHKELSLLVETEPLRADQEEQSGPGGGIRAGGVRRFGSGMFGGGRSVTGQDETTVKYSITTVDDMIGFVKNIISIFDYIALIVFAVLLVITMVGITNTFRMILLERIREIGTIRAIGMQRKEVRNLFLTEAVLIALGGAAAGIIVALIIMGIIGMVSFQGAAGIGFVLNKGHLLFRIDILTILRNISLLIIFSLGAAWFPAVKAAKLEPADALRTQH